MEEQTQQLNPQPGAPAPEVDAGTQLPEDWSADRVKEHYLDAIGALIEDATKRRKLKILVDVMALNLARVVFDYGPDAAGHVLERLGTHISYFNERKRGAKEAEEARNAGHQPH